MGKFIGQLKDDLGFNKIFRRDEELATIIEDNEVFFNVELEFEDAVDFKENPDFKLDVNQFFYVDYSSFDEDVRSKIQSYYDVINSTGEVSTLAKENLENIDFLIYGKKISNKVKLNFQSITPKYFIKSKSFLKFNSHIVYHHEKDVLEFKDELNIHIDENSKKIYFKHFSELRKIHKDFIELYSEATLEEKDEFIIEVNDYDLFSIDDSNLNLQQTNLKKLKHILDNDLIQIVFKNEKKVEKYIKKYQKGLKLRKIDNKFIVSNNRDFTALMKIIYENYYKGEITGKKLESNSTKTLL